MYDGCEGDKKTQAAIDDLNKSFMADMRTFYRYFCMLQKEAQGPDGTFHLFAPGYAPIGVAFALGYTWNTAGVVIPWQTYLQYGDLTVLRENYPAMRLHIYGMMDMKAEGRNYLTSHIGFLGDHLSVTDTDPSLMDNAQYYRAVRIVQHTAELLQLQQVLSVQIPIIISYLHIRATVTLLLSVWQRPFILPPETKILRLSS